MAMVSKMLVKTKGFTLIEILVVISVIGVLVSLVAASFSTGQKRSRDAKRRADITAIQQSLEQCYALTAVYPAAVTINQPLVCGSQTTMNLVPADPKNASPLVYTYSVNGNQTAYCLCSLLEQAGGGNASSAGASGSCSFGGSQDYYCLGSQQ